MPCCQCPAFTQSASSTTRRADARISENTVSAVDSVNTSGVCASTMPRRVRSATSNWSKPTEMVDSAFEHCRRDLHARTDAAVRVFQRGHERVVLRGVDLHDLRVLLQIREHVFGQRLPGDDLFHQLIFLATG
jgi:hypothetical protein